MSKETKISNIELQIKRNENKIQKLKFINKKLSNQIIRIEASKTESTTPTLEERVRQSEADRNKFQNELKRFNLTESSVF